MIALDTNIFIYALTGHPEFGRAARELLARGESESITASVLVIGELLGTTRPGHTDELSQATAMFQKLRGLTLITADDEILYEAANLMRAHTSLRLADAIHLATASQAGANEFWTNDKKLAQVELDSVTIRQLN